MKECKKCGRELTNAVSIARGMGPKCWADSIHIPNQHIKELFGERGTLAPNRAQFTWGIEDGVLWLIDTGNGHLCKSLTNDMEAALVSIQADLPEALIEYKIIYQDREGQWDGIKITQFNGLQIKADAEWLQPQSRQSHCYHPQGLDIDFYSLGGTDQRSEAIKRVNMKNEAKKEEADA